MRINNNLMAINTHRQLGISSGEGAKSMEKLSSGFRINRAGDDAAGLAISEKMRGQIRGLGMASKNSSDTISLIQIAEGALGETHAILQRMRELSVQASNDTNTNADRAELQSEISQLIKEVDRIGNTTEFNTKKLLDGSARGISDNVDASAILNPNSAIKVNLDVQNAFQANVADDRNFLMNGAHMLVRINKSDGKDIENDYALIGPDGALYRFEQGTGAAATDPTKATSMLNANTILTKAQKISTMADTAAFKTFVQGELQSALEAALADKAIGTYEGADFTNLDAAKSEAMSIARSIIDGLKDKFGQNKVISAALDGMLEKQADTIRNAITESATNTVVVGTLALTTDGIENTDALDKAVSALTSNVTVGSGSTIAAKSELSAGSILAVNSTFTVTGTTGTPPVAGSSVYINVDGAKVTISVDASGTVRIGDTALAKGASMTLKDGTILRNDDANNGEITVTQGSVTLAAEASTAASGAAGINVVAKNSVLAVGSTLADNTVLGIGTVIGSSKNTQLIRGSVEFSANANSITFADKHTLSADFSVMDVGLSSTFVFKTFQAGSNDLENSVMGQVGANSGQILFVSMNDMRAAALSIDNVDVSSRYGAATAIELVNNALQAVSHQRSTLGAMQNRLEHTIKNLDTAAENIQAAESRIRDVDMAKEVMENTKQNILQQASQAMLAQANQAPQAVLQLLR